MRAGGGDLRARFLTALAPIRRSTAVEHPLQVARRVLRGHHQLDVLQAAVVTPDRSRTSMAVGLLAATEPARVEDGIDFRLRPPGEDLRRRLHRRRTRDACRED